MTLLITLTYDFNYLLIMTLLISTSLIMTILITLKMGDITYNDTAYNIYKRNIRCMSLSTVTCKVIYKENQI